MGYREAQRLTDITAPMTIKQLFTVMRYWQHFALFSYDLDSIHILAIIEDGRK
jgi:hypothetical protein